MLIRTTLRILPEALELNTDQVTPTAITTNSRIINVRTLILIRFSTNTLDKSLTIYFKQSNQMTVLLRTVAYEVLSTAELRFSQMMDLRNIMT